MTLAAHPPKEGVPHVLPRTNQHRNTLLPFEGIHTSIGVAGSCGGSGGLIVTLGAPSSFIGEVFVAGVDFSATMLPAATAPAAAGITSLVMVANTRFRFGRCATCTQHVSTNPTHNACLCQQWTPA